MNASWVTHTVNLAGNELEMLHRQWLLTNGTGAYAMGTLPAINTHRYHGLLVAASHPPVGRIMALNQVFEQLLLTSPTGTQTLEWSSCLFQQPDGTRVQTPQGHTLLRRFDRGLTVRWGYVFKHLQFTRELILHDHAQAATVRYQIAGLAPGESAVLRLHPMVTLRDFHALYHKADDIAVQIERSKIHLTRQDLHVDITCPQTMFQSSPDGWYDIHYPCDAQRGQDDREDYFLPGFFEKSLQPGPPTTVDLHVQLGDSQPLDDNHKRAERLGVIRDHLSPRLGADAAMMAIASDDFVVSRTVGKHTLSTILAGYPWFADWGRDTFIALPGLLLCTGRLDEARNTLKAFASVIRDGRVPNRFDDYDQSTSSAHYNSVDASLWFIRAAHAYMDHAGDQNASDQANQDWADWLQDAIRQIIDAYIRGADPEVRMAGDGMIYAGNAQTQLTWMDAKCNDVVFTPRQGKAVEINALWYCALAQTADRLRSEDSATANHYTKLMQRIKRSFTKTFWDEERQCLRDHVWQTDNGDEEHADRSIRPNQIFAASLPYSPLPQTKQRHMVKTVAKHLLTRYGLRTLAPNDPHYHPHYAGNQFERDEAYHQGTVWPWLIGPYAEAVLRVGKFSKDAKAQAAEAIRPLVEFMKDQSLGQLYEIHEAQPPHQPVGCMAQAWSLAEVLRVWCMIKTPKLQ